MTRVVSVLVLMLSSTTPAVAQITPAAGYTPPDDTPSIRVGAVIYADYTFQSSPETTDADGNVINPNSFNVTRSYINVTGNISHVVAFRVTPDVAREINAASSLNGSLEFRIKYAYAQFNLDDWMTKGSYARLGIQQTPWLDFAEGIYRYRFQGTMFVEREGYFASADAGASFHYQLPSNYGDVHAGVFNGENYNRAEANDQKAFMVRATVRPLPAGLPVLRGIRGSVFYDGDHYVKDADRNRFIASVAFEHPYINASVEYLDTKDRPSTSIADLQVDGRGYSIWATPRTPKGWEGLIRYDHLRPNALFASRVRNRTIVGVAYWFPHQGTVTSALLLDYDGQTFQNFAISTPKQSRVGVHGLISF
jgi:Phosphate-selective porin O and P